MSKKLSYISLFSGAGGLDLGLERSGFRTISMSEIEPAFCETLRENQRFVHCDGQKYFESTKILNADIRELSSKDLMNSEVPDLVVGGPPCQAFSSSGKQLSVLDSRGELVNEFYRLIDEIEPKMLLFENVRGIVTARDKSGEPGGVIAGLLNNFRDIGYSCRAVLLNSADYGTYQRRVRCFIIGSRQGTAPHFPEVTNSKSPGLLQVPWKTLKEFLVKHADKNANNFTFPTEKLAAEFRDVPNGSGLKSKGKAEKTRPGGHWGYRQGAFIADLKLPARTVVGSSSQDWIRWDGLLRRLTLNEVKLLQGFPVDWEVIGTKAQIYKQIGNAVPSIFGEMLGNTMKQFLSSYPDTPPQFLDIPCDFKAYIDYTKRDHARNHESRVRHKIFASQKG
ncbi:MAG: DNA cytosine methyltransferase [Proteobacteria bacterium]|nr:DNA cytosine methyltransferase [Pseudomonadota bacterium]